MKRLLLILCIIFMFDRVGYSPEYKTLTIEKPTPIFYLSMEDINLWIKECRIKYPSIVRAQINLETGYLTSKIFKENKNLFGMRYPFQRETTALGELYNHAFYKDYKESVIDYKIWQSLYYHKGENYYTFLQRMGYATDEKYLKKLQKIVKQ